MKKLKVLIFLGNEQVESLDDDKCKKIAQLVGKKMSDYYSANKQEYQKLRGTKWKEFGNQYYGLFTSTSTNLVRVFLLRTIYSQTYKEDKMLKIENRCCLCDSPYGCSGCNLTEVKVHYCDKCHEEISLHDGEVFEVDDKEYCEDCLKELFQKTQEDEVYEES